MGDPLSDLPILATPKQAAKVMGPTEAQVRGLIRAGTLRKNAGFELHDKHEAARLRRIAEEHLRRMGARNDPGATNNSIIPHEAAPVDKIITGAPRIAKFLRASRMTVLRMIEDKRLAAFKTGGNTSPWKCWLSEIEARPPLRRSHGARRMSAQDRDDLDRAHRAVKELAKALEAEGVGADKHSGCAARGRGSKCRNPHGRSRRAREIFPRHRKGDRGWHAGFERAALTMVSSGNIVRSRGAANCIREPGGLPEYGRGRIWPSSSDADPAAIQAKAH
jgi:hypothetical protein